MGDFLRVTGSNVVKGAGRFMYAAVPATVAYPTEIDDVALTTAGGTQWDANTGWNDFGATFGGITINRGFDTESYTVDQVAGDLGEDLTGWTNSVEAPLAETTPAILQIVWEGSSITTNTTTVSAIDEDNVGFGDPTSVTFRQLVVLFMDAAGLVRMYHFRKAKLSGDESSMTHEKGGDPMTVNAAFNCFPDTDDAGLAQDNRIFQIFQQV